MRSPLLALLILSACASTPVPAEDGQVVSAPADAGFEDAPELVDAGAESPNEVDAGIGSDAAPEPHEDAGELHEDAGELDAGTADAGDVPAEPDASTRVDAGSPPSDSGPSPVPDAGPLPILDAGCAADALELNDSPAEAILVASGTGWTPSTYPLTWSPGDGADWIRAELDSTGVVGLFRVHAADSDSRAMVEVRVTCPSGVAVCRGSSAERVGAACVGRRMFNAFVDVACNTAAPSAVDVLVGVERGTRACDHELRVSLAAVP